jgi:hypothetical protein
MTQPTSRACTLGAALADLGQGAQLVTAGEGSLARLVDGATVWSGLSAPAPGVGTVVVCPEVESAAELTDLLNKVPREPSRVLIVRVPPALDRGGLSRMSGDHVLVAVDSALDPADVVLAIGRAIEVPDQTISRRLSALQRSLTQVLSDPDPVPALLGKLKALCNATAALIDKRGQAVQSTGPLPLNLLMREITSTRAASQSVQVDGWCGLADRITDPTQEGEHFGWLVVAARRADFPDPYAAAAIHVATTLVEASYRMTYVAQAQERAIRSAVLEEALALESAPSAPELAGRISSFGLSFAEDMRAVVCEPTNRPRSGRGHGLAARIEEVLTRALAREGIAHLVSSREQYATLLVQSTPAAIRRILVTESDNLPDMRVGIGRAVSTVADVANSYHDAQLAVRSLSRVGADKKVMAYDEFDFATRLFSDVGLDRMLAWAERFFAPLDQRGPLFESLRVFFEQSQNINSAAEVLHVHHNSLRYRLAKAEELLGVSLRDPAAVSSVFLALTAVDLGRMQVGASTSKTGTSPRPSDIEAPGTPAEVSSTAGRLGVVLRPDH